MSQKNFASYGDMETLVAEIADKCGPYTEISYEDWLQLTPYQQEHGRWDVTGVPGADGTISIDLMTLGWQNSDVSQDFTPQYVTLPSTDYDYLMISYILTKGSSSLYANSQIFPRNYNGTISMVVTATDLRNRSFTVSENGKKISFGNAYSGTTVDNSRMIPVAIHLIKLHHTVEIKAIAPTVSTLAENCVMSDGETSVEDALDGLQAWGDEVDVPVTNGHLFFSKHPIGLKRVRMALSVSTSEVTYSNIIPDGYVPVVNMPIVGYNNNGGLRHAMMYTNKSVIVLSSNFASLFGQQIYT